MTFSLKTPGESKGFVIALFGEPGKVIIAYKPAESKSGF